MSSELNNHRAARIGYFQQYVTSRTCGALAFLPIQLKYLMRTPTRVYTWQQNAPQVTISDWVDTLKTRQLTKL